MKRHLLCLVALSAAPAFAQWVPGYDREFTAEPHCNAQREQVKVRLLQSTKFTFSDDVPAGTVLYGIRIQRKDPQRRDTAVAYCQLYQPKELSIWSGHGKRQFDEIKRARGFEMCFQDLNEDGVFDQVPDGHVIYSEATKASGSSDNLPYEVLAPTGKPELGCPRVVPKDALMSVSAKFWNALSPAEMDLARAKGPIDVIPATEVGAVVDVQRIDKSSAATNFGRDGAAAAERRYAEKASAQGNYSQVQAAQARNLGAALLSLFDVPADKAVLVRYTVRDHSGELVTVDKIDSGEGFTHAVGTCLAIPSAAKLSQSVCEGSVDGLRQALFGTAPGPNATAPAVAATTTPGVATPLAGKEQKLLDLKRLFERGLISEKVYNDEQRAILSQP